MVKSVFYDIEKIIKLLYKSINLKNYEFYGFYCLNAWNF